MRNFTINLGAIKSFEANTVKCLAYNDQHKLVVVKNSKEAVIIASTKFKDGKATVLLQHANPNYAPSVSDVQSYITYIGKHVSKITEIHLPKLTIFFSQEYKYHNGHEYVSNKENWYYTEQEFDAFVHLLLLKEFKITNLVTSNGEEVTAETILSKLELTQTLLMDTISISKVLGYCNKVAKTMLPAEEEVLYEGIYVSKVTQYTDQLTINIDRRALISERYLINTTKLKYGNDDWRIAYKPLNVNMSQDIVYRRDSRYTNKTIAYSGTGRAKDGGKTAFIKINGERYQCAYIGSATNTAPLELIRKTYDWKVNYNHIKYVGEYTNTYKPTYETKMPRKIVDNDHRNSCCTTINKYNFIRYNTVSVLHLNNKNSLIDYNKQSAVKSIMGYTPNNSKDIEECYNYIPKYCAQLRELNQYLEYWETGGVDFLNKNIYLDCTIPLHYQDHVVIHADSERAVNYSNRHQMMLDDAEVYRNHDDDMSDIKDRPHMSGGYAKNIYLATSDPDKILEAIKTLEGTGAHLFAMFMIRKYKPVTFLKKFSYKKEINRLKCLKASYKKDKKEVDPIKALVCARRQHELQGKCCIGCSLTENSVDCFYNDCHANAEAVEDLKNKLSK